MDFDQFVTLARGEGIVEWWIRKNAFECFKYVQENEDGYTEEELYSHSKRGFFGIRLNDPLTDVHCLRNETGLTCVCTHMDCNLDFTDQYL